MSRREPESERPTTRQFWVFVGPVLTRGGPRERSGAPDERLAVWRVHRDFSDGTRRGQFRLLHAARSDAPVVVVTGASAGLRPRGRRGFWPARWRSSPPATPRGRPAGRRGRGGLGGPARCDVADAGAVLAAADRIAAEWGRIDVWINPARPKPLDKGRLGD